MTLTFLFLGPDLFGLNDLSREEIGLTRTDHLKQNIPITVISQQRCIGNLSLAARPFG